MTQEVEMEAIKNLVSRLFNHVNRMQDDSFERM